MLNVTQNTRPSLYTYVKVWAWDYSQVRYAVPGFCCLHANCIDLHLRHSCMFAYSQTRRTFIFFKFTLLLPITKASLLPVSMTMFAFGQGDRPHKVWHASFRQCELMRSQCTIQFLIIRRAVARIDWSVAYFDLLLHIHCMSSILPTNGGC